MKNFGETIREIRENKGLLLRQVAAAIEVDTALVSKLERGERKAQREQVSKLARFLEMPEDTLLVVWLSDKVLEILEEEPLAGEALKQTAKRINRS
ncbi:helix-turn-helix domain-containing protein [Chitinophaga nivalis]|uniref:Helix-turn-helix domain-containing protein n=1 Tax=Chitinophaga nivalis TaxID=2991709 RepID=A0ABT3IE88_9BACT|nr:helix-turn-helix transcriptional regulator [Chitinophaga nivalis]MCW3468032.1 helix-turn-helix domain-containing protein [Chitinophaga nivalis]MCW3482277.1 helix-turn-helix domain-containing protein [Chitinophaga nivalis]